MKCEHITVEELKICPLGGSFKFMLGAFVGLFFCSVKLFPALLNQSLLPDMCSRSVYLVNGTFRRSVQSSRSHWEAQVKYRMNHHILVKTIPTSPTAPGFLGPDSLRKKRRACAPQCGDWYQESLHMALYVHCKSHSKAPSE